MKWVYPPSTIVNAFLKQFIREKRVTFEIPLEPNAKTAKLLREIDADIRAIYIIKEDGVIIFKTIGTHTELYK